MLLRSFGLLSKVVVLFTVIVVCLLDLIVSPCIEVASFKLNYVVLELLKVFLYGLASFVL